MTEIKRVFITGVSAGLGKALAERYLESGWQVYGLSRRTPSQLIDHERFRFMPVDLAKLDTIEGSLQQLIDANSLDLVILNAGVLGRFGDMADADLGAVQNTMNVNVWANKIIIDYLHRESIGIKQLVAISSGASVSGSRGWNGYGVSKAALNMLIRLYAAELNQTHFCALAPGLIDSNMQEYLCGLENEPRYPTLARIQSCRNTENMPGPKQAAEMLIQAIERLPSVAASGDFADIRSLKH